MRTCWLSRMALPLTLLLAGAHLLSSPALAQTPPAPPTPPAHTRHHVSARDSVLTGDQIKSIQRQLDGTDTTKNTELWEEYKKYHEKDSSGRTPTGERVKVGDSVIVNEDEHILGDVVSIGGNVVVRGAVDGDVVAVGGDVDVHDEADIKGDAVSVGGRVHKMGNGHVAGETVSVNVPIPHWGRHGPEIVHPRFFSSGWKLGLFVVGLLLVLMLQAVAGSRLDVISRRVESEPGQSFLIGLLGLFGTPIACLIALVLLAITIIGILLFPVLIILVWLMLLGGFAAVALAVGRRLLENRGPADALRTAHSPWAHMLLGYVVLKAFLILSFLAGATPLPLGPLAVLFTVLSVFVLVFATTLGYGAVLLSRLGKQNVAAPQPGVHHMGPFTPTWPSAPPPPPPPGPPPGPPMGSPPQAPPPPGAGPGAPSGGFTG